MRTKWWVNSRLNEPVVSLKEPGAADHSSVEWDGGFNLVLSMLGLRPSNYLLFVIVNSQLIF